jgi:hypothetical protein
VLPVVGVDHFIYLGPEMIEVHAVDAEGSGLSQAVLRVHRA